MDPRDTSADAVTGPATLPTAADEDSECGEDTLDLRLPDEFLALIAQEAVSEAPPSTTATPAPAPAVAVTTGPTTSAPPSPPTAQTASASPPVAASAASNGHRTTDDLLDHVADWGPVTTPVGKFQLIPVHGERDLPLIGAWMNDPAVARFWELSGAPGRTADHLRTQLAGDGRSVPCLGVLDGTPMSYWEIYRADLDPLARHYPARPHDTGVHLLIGAAENRGRGIGSALLRAVADLILDKRPACARVIAEPDLRNTPSVSSFLSAGFRFAAEIDLPDKRAALMVRERSFRDVL
ncbi:GNAT family N-acetyltransferase [Streptomyces sp. NPDC090106]|uniref:GNAT family N-acetyltransferase n=1 Tax=Streptomyces sp. NPDC090106 TaxID=3365946 RepID=UPI00382E0B07